MGRHCGYLALMAAVAGGCDYVLVPELPPGKDWEEDMCSKLKAGREAGRRESMVIVAEGATDREGNRITANDVRQVIADKLGEAARVTILGHVQRGGRPSAYDRWMSMLLGCAAAREVMSFAFAVDEVAQGAAAFFDGAAQGFADVVYQCRRFFAADLHGGAVWGDAGGKQAFVGVDVAYADDGFVVHQYAFYRAAAFFQGVEDSTRTRLSFEAVVKRLSADVINFSAKGSSLSKGESLRDRKSVV